SRAISSHSVAYGRRCSTFVSRLGLIVYWNVLAPLGQSVPSLIGLSGLPSMSTTRPSCTWTSIPQPTAQYGQTLGTVVTSRRRECCRRVRSLTAAPSMPSCESCLATGQRVTASAMRSSVRRATGVLRSGDDGGAPAARARDGRHHGRVRVHSPPPAGLFGGDRRRVQVLRQAGRVRPGVPGPAGWRRRGRADSA